MQERPHFKSEAGVKWQCDWQQGRQSVTRTRSYVIAFARPCWLRQQCAMRTDRFPLEVTSLSMSQPWDWLLTLEESVGEIGVLSQGPKAFRLARVSER